MTNVPAARGQRASPAPEFEGEEQSAYPLVDGVHEGSVALHRVAVSGRCYISPTLMTHE
jgi:hypothetical protein